MVSADAHALFEREKALLLHARHGHAIRIRYWLSGFGALLAFANLLAGLFPGSPWVLVGAAALTTTLNLAADRARRRNQVALWHFWSLLVTDTLAIGVGIAMLGDRGALGGAFYIVAAGSYALGLPTVARAQLLLALAVYPLARAVGLTHFTAAALPFGLIITETVLLFGLGTVACRGAIRFTHRLGKVRQALAALEHGDFSARLPVRGRDDLGFLAVSFNSTAQALHDTVTALSTQVAERQRAEREVARTLSLVQATLESTADGILVVDPEGKITSYNRKFGEMWRIPIGVLELADDRELVRRVFAQLEEPDRFRAHIDALYASPDAESFDELRFTDGRIFERCSTPQRLDTGEIVGRVWSFRDVTARTRLEEQLTHHAFHDALTGLANRVRLRERVEHALERAGRTAERIAVLFIDLDGFKTINDSLGHGAGDRLLAMVADRLLNATRGCDTVARMGGDEFAVLIENVNEDADAIRVADRIACSMHRPFLLDATEVFVSASIGIARAALAEDGESSAEALLRNADVAMYRAKAAGKGRWEVFQPHMHQVARERLLLEAELRQAMERHELRLAYQPIVELSNGRMMGLEALIRWQHPERGNIPPGVFIPIAEETGLIVPLGRWVVREACRQAAHWQQLHGAEQLSITVNLSGRQFQEDAMVGEVATTLAETGLDPSSLILEITESAIVQHTDTMLSRMHELKALGIRLAIDDFGTGYSSLSYLQRFPIDILKIDKAFVDGLGRDESEAALARTIIALAEMLCLRTIAEGIEERDQCSHLMKLGCEYGQGYLFDRPLEVEDVERRLRRSVVTRVA